MFFVYEVSGEVMAKFCQKLFYAGRHDLLEMLIQRLVEFPTAVTQIKNWVEPFAGPSES
jgi:hypothetical protein